MKVRVVGTGHMFRMLCKSRTTLFKNENAVYGPVAGCSVVSACMPIVAKEKFRTCNESMHTS